MIETSRGIEVAAAARAAEVVNITAWNGVYTDVDKNEVELSSVPGVVISWLHCVNPGSSETKSRRRVSFLGHRSSDGGRTQ